MQIIIIQDELAMNSNNEEAAFGRKEAVLPWRCDVELPDGILLFAYNNCCYNGQTVPKSFS